MMTSPTQDVEIGPSGIRLGQFLKFAGLVESGGEVKDLLASGLVSVNGVPVEASAASGAFNQDPAIPHAESLSSQGKSVFGFHVPSGISRVEIRAS